MKIVDSETMRQLDRRTVDAGTADAALMEQAGTAAYEELLRSLPLVVLNPERASYRILTGKGNNAGDGLVLARLLHQDGFDCSILAAVPLETMSDAAAQQADALPPEIPLVALTEDALRDLPDDVVLIDALLGTGIRGTLRPPYDTLVPAINQCRCPVVSVDLPSGLDADTGETATDSVQADLTITMALPKSGLLEPPGRRRCGLLRVVDIGIPDAFVAEAVETGEALFRQDVSPLLNRRPADGHKRTFGDLLIVGGSLSYAGAPMLAGGGALRSGTGLVRVALPWMACNVAPRRFASLIALPAGPPQGRYLTAACVEDISGMLARTDAVVFGPGVGKPREAVPVLRSLLHADRPMLIDADGLRALAQLDTDSVKQHPPTVLTPHPGEMRVLLEGFGLQHVADQSRRDQALALAQRLGATVVLKGLGSVIATPAGQCAVNTSGTAALATAGTGDVLAGMIGGLLAQGLSPWDACRCATFIHGLAGELSPFGQRGLTADDLADLIPDALRQCTPFP